MSTAVGRQAETTAADWLSGQGFTIIARNFRTQQCEIDIIATKKRVIYFVEVKYRRSNQWGSGLEYITPQKVRQMHFAAKEWLAQASSPRGSSTRLAAIEITGPQFAVSHWLESIEI